MGERQVQGELGRASKAAQGRGPAANGEIKPSPAGWNVFAENVGISNDGRNLILGVPESSFQTEGTGLQAIPGARSSHL